MNRVTGSRGAIVVAVVLVAGSAAAAPRPPSAPSVPSASASGPDEPIGGAPDYRASIALWQRLIERFPDDPHTDAAHYLLGYALGRMGRDDEARSAFLALVCAPSRSSAPSPSRSPSSGDPYAGCAPLRPGSPFLPEAWMRLGELHFDAAEHDAARAAYARVLAFPESPFYDKALYKLAWSHYIVDHFQESARRFDALVAWADARRAGSELRSEAIRYIAVALAEPAWDGEGASAPAAAEVAPLRRIEAFYRGREATPHVREVFRTLGDVLYDGTDYVAATDVHLAFLRRWPEAAEAPAVHERVIAACSACVR